MSTLKIEKKKLVNELEKNGGSWGEREAGLEAMRVTGRRGGGLSDKNSYC